MLGNASLALRAAPREFWNGKDPAGWSEGEKQALLTQSPWAREGFVRMETERQRPAPGQGDNVPPGGGMPDTRPGLPPGAVRSVPIGEAPPPPPKPDTGRPVQFRVLARWETAKPVRLAGAPDLPELSGDFYVIRLRGLPLMPPAKAQPGEPAPDPNQALLQALKEGSRLERTNKPAIPCTHLFTGSGDASSDVLLFFPRRVNPITAADKSVTLECRFPPFHLSVRFPLKDMLYRGALAL